VGFSLAVLAALTGWPLPNLGDGGGPTRCPMVIPCLPVGRACALLSWAFHRFRPASSLSSWFARLVDVSRNPQSAGRCFIARQG